MKILSIIKAISGNNLDGSSLSLDKVCHLDMLPCFLSFVVIVTYGSRSPIVIWLSNSVVLDVLLLKDLVLAKLSFLLETFKGSDPNVVIMLFLCCKSDIIGERLDLENILPSIGCF